MSEPNYFQRALSDFTFDVASGGEIRHYADNGYTVARIMKALDFPTPIERVQKTVWEHFMETGVLLDAEPGTGKKREKAEYVVEFDRYGRKSFRRVTTEEGTDGSRTVWQEHIYSAAEDGPAEQYLAKLCTENGDEAYAYCDFGLRAKREPERFEEALAKTLDPEEREYVTGLFFERRPVWHRLDPRMQKIIARMYAGGEYRGDCWFLKTGKKVRFTDPQ